MPVSFGDVCRLLQDIEKLSTRQPRLDPGRKKRWAQEIISNWFQLHRRNLDDPNANGGALLSALFPHRRKDRVYGLRAPLLSKKLTTLLQFNHGQKALFDGWPTGTHGDLGAYLERAMKLWDGTFRAKRTIPLERVDRLLVQLAAKYRFSDETIRQKRDWHISTDAELKEILIRLESWEAKWLVRLVLREYYTIDLDERYVLQQYHFLLPELLMFQNDFDVVLEMLRGELAHYPPVPKPEDRRRMRIDAAQQLKAIIGIKVGRPTFYKAWSLKHCFQLVGNRAWAAEVKYDGEYCEIHIDIEKAPNEIKIFSKNGKDATADRQPLHDTIRRALRLGRPECPFKKQCIMLGEMVPWSDKEKTILPFSKIRKHISRSGSFLGTLQDSLPHEWEQLMIVFFDVLALDEEPVLRQSLQERRRILRDVVQVIPGRSMRSEWTLLDFKTEDGITDLKQAFARTLAHRQEGLVLKPLHSPYFPLLTENGQSLPGFFIKVKKDYLGDMGGERDLGDFAIIGASFDPQVAPKAGIRPLHWTHFYVGCLTNKIAVQRNGQKPCFKVVSCLSLDKCIPTAILKFLNVQGFVRHASLGLDGSKFGIEHSKGYGRQMEVVFKTPFVAEILGGGYEKVQNESFEMLRHPRIKKLHHDRTWEDAVTMEDLERMAEEKWEVPNANKLDGHARDVALLVKEYRNLLSASQISSSTSGATETETQRTSQFITQEGSTQTNITSDAVVQETPLNIIATCTTSSTTQCSGSTQGIGIYASRETRLSIHEDIQSDTPCSRVESRTTVSSGHTTTVRKRRSLTEAASTISPPTSKRRRLLRSPLKEAAGGNGSRKLGTLEFDSQEKTIHIYAEEGLGVQVQADCDEKEK